MPESLLTLAIYPDHISHPRSIDKKDDAACECLFTLIAYRRRHLQYHIETHDAEINAHQFNGNHRITEVQRLLLHIWT